MHRQVGVSLQFTIITPLPDSRDLQLYVFFGLYLLRKTMFFSQEKHKISLPQSSPSLKLLSPAACVFNIQFHCYCTEPRSMTLGGKCQVCTYNGAIMDLYYGATQTVTAKSISVRLPYLQAYSRH